MKKELLMGIALIASIGFLLSSCKSGQKEVKNEKSAEEMKADSISAFIDRNYLPIDEFKALMQSFEDDWYNPPTSGIVFDIGEKHVAEALEPYGFEVYKDNFSFLITATRHCKAGTEDYSYYKITSDAPDSLTAAYVFRPCGDFYVIGEMLLPNEDIYGGMLEKIKAAGYQPDGDNLDFCGDKNSPDYEENYRNDVFYFTCNKSRLTITLHYDWQLVQEQKWGNL